MLIYIYSYPLWIGYVLIAALVIYIVIRGIAEVYEATLFGVGKIPHKTKAI